MKKIEILYFEGCPNHRATVELVREVVCDLAIDADIEEIEVRDQQEATRLRFLGSPTVRVDGADIEPAARSSTAYALACRRYGDRGVPPRSLLAAALATGNPSGPGGCSGSTSSGSLGGIAIVAAASALLASACCIGPLVLSALGLAAAVSSALLLPARPYLLLLTVLLLAAAFYRSYFRAPARQCLAASLPARRLGRSLIWVAALVVLAIAFFPAYGGSLLPAGEQGLKETQGQPHHRLTLTIEGMTCEACARLIENELAAIAGVARAEVEYSRGRALVTLTPGATVSVEALTEAVEKAGYKARLADGS